MRQRSWGICGLALGALLCAGAQAAPAVRKTTPTDFFDLRRLDELSGLSAVERARKGAAFIREEVATPSRTGMGGDGVGIIDHDYILGNMAAIIARKGLDRPALRLEYSKLGPGEAKDAVAVVLGLGGDRAVVPHLINLLSRSGYLPHLRTHAARALGALPDPATIPYAAQVLAADPTWRINYRRNLRTNKAERKVRDYFVRAAALKLLQDLEGAGLYIKPEIGAVMATAVVEENIPWDPKTGKDL